MKIHTCTQRDNSHMRDDGQDSHMRGDIQVTPAKLWKLTCAHMQGDRHNSHMQDDHTCEET